MKTETLTKITFAIMIAGCIATDPSPDQTAAAITADEQLAVPPASIQMIAPAERCRVKVLVDCERPSFNMASTCAIGDNFWDRVEEAIVEKCGPNE